MCKCLCTYPYFLGFQYTHQCPANFTSVMAQCEAQFLGPNELPFLKTNDLIADATRKDVRVACRLDKNVYDLNQNNCYI